MLLQPTQPLEQAENAFAFTKTMSTISWTPAEAAQALGISQITLSRDRQNGVAGGIPYVRLGAPILRVLGGVIKILLKPILDHDRYAQLHDFPRLTKATLAVESEKWLSMHIPAQSMAG